MRKFQNWTLAIWLITILLVLISCKPQAKGPLSEEEASPLQDVYSRYSNFPMDRPIEFESPSLKPIVDWEFDGTECNLRKDPSITVDIDGGIIFTSKPEGEEDDPNSRSNIFYELVRVSPDGQIHWVHLIKNEYDETPKPQIIGLTRNSVILIHSSIPLYNTQGELFSVECVDLSGHRRWITDQFPSGTHTHSFVRGVGNTFTILNDDGTIYQHSLLDGARIREIPPAPVSGKYLTQCSNFQVENDFIRTTYSFVENPGSPDLLTYTTFRTDSDGNLKWEVPKPEYFTDLVKVNGKLVGDSWSGLRIINPESWEMENITDSQYPQLLGVSSDGNLLITSSKHGPPDPPDHLSMINIEGTELWSITYPWSNNFPYDYYFYGDSKFLIVDRLGISLFSEIGQEEWRLDSVDLGAPVFPDDPLDRDHRIQAWPSPDQGIILYLQYPDPDGDDYIRRLIKLKQPD